MTPALPDAFLAKPIAHRALHDGGKQRPENSMAAIRAAVEAGYGIEFDVQLSLDGVAKVFHDYRLDRLTPHSGFVRDHTSAVLRTMALHGGQETIPTLAACLAEVKGRVPLLIEIKDQDEIGPLESAVTRDLAKYDGPVAVMSFNPNSVAAMRAAAPDLPLGLTTCAFHALKWPSVKAELRKRLRKIEDFEQVGASFISHDWTNLHNPAVSALKARGVPVLCWTVRSHAEERAARKVADNITFEGYTPGTTHA